MTRCISRLALTLALAALVGCAAPRSNSDYTAFRLYQPKSVLVLPPLNDTTDLRATYSMLSTVTSPLAEAGYYVFPVALVDQTFKENGLLTAGEMHQATLAKLHEIFGADAALYITVTRYGASSALLGGEVIVAAQAKLVDTRSGTLLWQGRASASDAEGKQQQSSLLGFLIQGIISQVVNTVGDPGHRVALITSQRLLSPQPGGLLPGPRSPAFEAAKPKP